MSLIEQAVIGRPATASPATAAAPLDSGAVPAAAVRRVVDSYNAEARQMEDLIYLLEQDIQDNAANATRFLVLGRQCSPPSGNDRTSLMVSIIDKVGAILKPFDNPIHVEGFTDDQPIHTAQFPTNWELSSARSASIAAMMCGKSFTVTAVSPSVASFSLAAASFARAALSS